MSSGAGFAVGQDQNMIWGGFPACGNGRKQREQDVQGDARLAPCFKLCLYFKNFNFYMLAEAGLLCFFFGVGC